MFPNGLQNSNSTSLDSIRTKKPIQEIRNEIALSTPLGKNSLLYKNLEQEILFGVISIPFTEGLWRYKMVHDYNATQLIKEFREENLALKNSKGEYDDEVDFIVYAEKDDFSISLGRVLLIKMSDAMIKYYYGHNNPNNFLNSIAKDLYEQQVGKNTFFYTEDEIVKTLVDAIKLQTKNVADISVLEVENYLKNITESISTFLHEDLKFTREQWDPTLKSESYLFAKPQDAVNYFVKKCDDATKELKKVKSNLEVIQSFKIIGLDFNTPYVSDLIKTLDNQIRSIQEFKSWLIENKEDLKLKIPYACGIWNGMIEFFSGIIDVALLAINVVVSQVLDEDINLELLSIRESLEEILEKILKDPSKVVKEAIETIKNYKYTRYNDPKLNKYQLQFNEGEDTILAIDLIVTIVTIIKGITKLAKQLPKFTKWIDEVLARNGKGARKIKGVLIDDYIKLSDELVEATKSKILVQNTDNLDELYKAAEIADKELKTVTNNFAFETEGKAGFRDGLKSRERALEKIESDYDGDVSRLVDIAGSKVVYETVDDLYFALNEFSKRYKILKIKDRIQKPLIGGYRDVLINIEMKNGHIVEFRLHIKAMDDAAIEGHKLYQQRRTLDAISSQRELNIDEIKLKFELVQKEKNLYNDAWNKIINKK